MDEIQKYHQDFYNQNAKRWATTKTDSFWHEPQFRKFVSYLKPGDSVLDIGCAYAIHVPLFLGIGRNLHYEGIDISQTFLKMCRQRYPQLSFQYGNIVERKTLPKKQYDAFWATAVLMHVPIEHWPQMIRNLVSISKPGAIGYITLPQQRPNERSQADERHFTYWSKQKLKKILAPYGWTVLHSGSMPDRTAKWQWYIVQLPKE